jgi:hypothetical protein
MGAGFGGVLAEVVDQCYLGQGAANDREGFTVVHCKDHAENALNYS